MWFAVLGLAVAQSLDLEALATRDGVPAAAEALAAEVAAAKSPKKLAKALEGSGLDRVVLPAKAAFGAELELTEVAPMTACRWEDGLVCSLRATTQSTIGPDDFQLQCRSKYGATAQIEVELEHAEAGRASWLVRRAEDCWALNGATVQILPTAHADLEGIGTGDDDLIAPELAGLTFPQVEKTILDQMNSFKACVAREDGPTVTGKLEVRFHIADDGRIDVAETASNGLDDPAAADCILERFRRVRFPPPNDGYTEGTFPFTFQ